MSSDDNWFEAATAILDSFERPYVLLAIDEVMTVGPVPEKMTNVLWRSRISREAAIELVRGFADQLEQQPEVLRGLNDSEENR